MTQQTAVKVAHPARIGDLLVVEAERHDYMIGQASQSRVECVVVEVANVFRDGRVKNVRTLSWDDAAAQPLDRWIGLRRAWLIEARAINKAAAIEEIRAHRYPTAQDSQMIMPWDDLRELTVLLRPHQVVKTGWQVR